MMNMLSMLPESNIIQTVSFVRLKFKQQLQLIINGYGTLLPFTSDPICSYMR